MFRQKGQLVRALYYTALAEEQEYSLILAPDRLAGLQRLLDGHEANQRVH